MRTLYPGEEASSSLVGRSKWSGNIHSNMVTWPSGKARVCKTLIHQFKSGRHLQKIPGSFGFRDFFVASCKGVFVWVKSNAFYKVLLRRRCTLLRAQKSTRKAPATFEAREARIKGYSPLIIPKKLGSIQKS